jgi:hypothetical protein
MTIDDQLRDIARLADQHQHVITAEEIVQRASVQGTGTRSRLNDRRKVLNHMPTAFTEEEATVIDLETSSQTAEHRKGPKLVLLVCLVAAAAVVVIALVAIRRNEPVSPADNPTTTSESPTTTSQAADDGLTTLAKGDDLEFVGTAGLAGQTLNVTAEEQDGEVTGEFRVGENVTTIECADTDTDGVVILGGAAASGPDVVAGDLLALIIREGDPDSVALLANLDNAGSCIELLESIPEDALTDESIFAVVEAGYDIETG